MIRFPNPGSEISMFINIFQKVYTYLNEFDFFTLDDMSKTMVGMNLASSSGYVGDEALKKSTRTDRSRDPLYNQSKMYCELYRLLGWIGSDDDTKLHYSFTLLGEYMANAVDNPKPLFEQCILGINYPNDILDSNTDAISRTFATILSMTLQLDGVTCRDELIIGAMSINDNKNSVDTMIKKIKDIRPNGLLLNEEIQKISDSTNIKINTLQNYTRWPISVLIYCGWFEKKKSSKLYENKKGMVELVITEHGRAVANELKKYYDLRNKTVSVQDEIVKKAITQYGFYSMLERANYDIEPVRELLNNNKQILNSTFNSDNYIFSPYQTFAKSNVDDYLEIRKLISSYRSSNDDITYFDNEMISSGMELLVVEKTYEHVSTETQIESEIKSLIKNHSDNKSIRILMQRYRDSKQTEFYPLIADLFKIIGFDCINPPAGRNPERWDAIVIDKEAAIPIEIKSPTEELHLSIKAIRQALENKIILLSRKSYYTRPEVVSLAVGYYYPNDRAEVNQLILDMKKTYGVKIAVFNLETLLKLSIMSISGKGKIIKDEFYELEGLIDVKFVNTKK